MTHDESTRTVEARKNRQEIFAREGNASGSRRKIGRCQMYEDGAAGARKRRIVVESDDDDEIVEMISTPHHFVPSSKGQGNRPVVVVVPRVIAPPVHWRDGRYWKRTLRLHLAIGSEEHPSEWPHTGRGAAVPLHLSIDDPGRTERTEKLAGAKTRAPLPVHHDVSHVGNVPVAAP